MSNKKKTYKDIIHKECIKYSKKKNTVFLGYNVSHGSKMYGTLNGIPNDKLLEMPVDENLIAGMAIGMALKGIRPVVCFERHDFMLIALDSIVNHMDKLPEISGNQFRLPIIIRAIVGGNNPIQPGIQHTQNYKFAFYSMLKHTKVFEPETEKEIKEAWQYIDKEDKRYYNNGIVLIIEYRDFYDLPIEEIKNQMYFIKFD